MNARPSGSWAMLLATLAGACGGNLTFRAIQVGKSLNSDNSVGVLATTFKRNDTIYAAILTDGSGSATLGARFSYGGRVMSKPEKRLSSRGSRGHGVSYRIFRRLPARRLRHRALRERDVGRDAARARRGLRATGIAHCRSAIDDPRPGGRLDSGLRCATGAPLQAQPDLRHQRVRARRAGRPPRSTARVPTPTTPS